MQYDTQRGYDAHSSSAVQYYSDLIKKMTHYNSYTTITHIRMVEVCVKNKHYATCLYSV